jgi:predicted Zn-dependent peptidase
MKKTVLKNGFTILSEHIPTSKSVTLSLFVGAGSYHERQYPAGVAHFLEHMFFKGTTNRNAQQINEEIDGIGGVLNAYTTSERTKYYTLVPYRHWKTGSNVLLDMIWNATFPEEEIERERNVILEEIKMYEDDPSSFVFDLLERKMHANQTERQSVIGTVESVKSITRETLISFVDEFYQPNNLIFVATGNIDHDELVSYVGSIPATRTKESTPSVSLEKTVFQEQHLTYTRDLQQAHLAWGSFGPSVYEKDTTVMKVIANLLGGSLSSRLYRIIREERGLAYSVSLDYSSKSDSGVLYGYVGTEKEKIDEIKQIILDEFEKLKTEPVPQDELQRAINYTSGLFMLGLENHSSLNEFYGVHALLETNKTPDDFIEQIERVTSDDILSVANRYFSKENFLFVDIHS